MASSDHDVVTAVLDDGHGRAIGAAEMTQVRENPHSFVREIDGRLHVAIAAGNPFLVDLSPVFRSQLAPGHVAELLLILCGEQTSSESSVKAWKRVAGEGEGGEPRHCIPTSWEAARVDCKRKRATKLEMTTSLCCSMV